MSVNFKALETWYLKRPDVNFEIIKFLYNRELALIVPSWVTDKALQNRSTRTLRAHNVQSLQYILGAGLRMFRGLGKYDEISTPYNFYYSLAQYREGIPKQTLNFAERDNKQWVIGHTKDMIGYDFLIDIDAGEHDDIEAAHNSTLQLIKLFDDKNLPYELRFSGKGFHIIVPYQYFGYVPPKFDTAREDSIYRCYAAIAKKLHKECSEMIDLNIYDSRRLCKLPYTWALYENDAYLCTPFLTKKDFMEFSLVQYHFLDKLETAPDCLNIRGRGTKVFNTMGTVKYLLDLIR